MTCSNCKKQLKLTTTQLTTGQVTCSNCNQSWQMKYLINLQEKNLLQPPKAIQLFTQNGVPLLKIKGQQFKKKQGWSIVVLLVIWLIHLFTNINLQKNIWGIAAILVLSLSLVFVLRYMFFHCTFLIDANSLQITEIVGYSKLKKKIQRNEIIKLTYKIEEESFGHRPHTQIVTPKKVYKIGLEMSEEASFYCYCWLKALSIEPND